MADQIELGDRVRDKLSSVKGIVTSITHWMYGCVRIGVQPEKPKDGKPAESFVVDEPQLEVIKKHVLVSKQIPPTPEPQPAFCGHGPRNDAAHPAIPSRH